MLESGMAQPNDVQEGLLRISKQAQRAGLVIRSIHDFVRRKTFVRETVDLRTVLKGIYPLIELQAKHLKTQVVLKSAQIIPDVLIDRLMLEQVMLNLTRNAMEAMKHLPINDRSLSINIQHRQTDTESKVHFCVSDCGDGVTDELGQKIFSAFFSTKEEGMGMGLAICRTVIEAAHGRLWYENTNKGCNFIFELPAHCS
jgi:two-component system sensor histidine kinase DctS